MSATTTTTVLTADAASAADAALAQQLSDLTARVTALEQGAVKPPIPPGPTPSPDGAKATAPGTILVDDALNQWQLVPYATFGNIVQWMPAGTAAWVAAGYSANVTAIEKFKTTCYQTNGTGWWSWNGTTWATAPGDPSAGTTPPPVTGTGPGASGSFVNVDFAAPFGIPVLAGAWGVSTGGAGDNDFAAFADPVLVNAFATINPRLWRFNGNLTTGGDSPYFNSDGSVNTGTWANIINNFYKANPTGDSGIIVGVNTNGVVGFSDPASYGRAMGNLAKYLFGAKMGNGKPFPIIGFESHNEPDGNVDVNTLVSYYNPAYSAIKAVSPNLMMFGPVTSYIQGGGGFSWGTFFNGVLGCDGITWHAYLGGYTADPNADPGRTFWNTTRGTDDTNAIPGAVPTKYKGTSIFLGEYNLDWNCQVPSQGNEVGAVFNAIMVMQVIDASTTPARAAIWDAYADGTCGVVQSGGRIVPGGYFLGKAGGTVSGPRVTCNRPSGLITCATMPAPGRITVMMVNKGNSLSGPVALSHWPGNATGSGSVNLWQQSPSVPNGGSSSVAVTAGMTGSITLPSGSITILNT